jgi:dihydrofolate reductase
MDLVVAVTDNWGIGLGGTQTVVIPEDRKYFRALTKGSTVILGRRTLMDFPGAKPLPKRRNIILTSDRGFSVEGGEVVHSVQEAVELTRDDGQVFVIGGASVYRQFLPLCRYAYVTRLYVDAEADRYLHDLDSDPDWRLCSPPERLTSENGIEYAFLKYENMNIKEL